MYTNTSDYYDNASEVPCSECISMAVEEGPCNRNGSFECGKHRNSQGDPLVPDHGKLHKHLTVQTVEAKDKPLSDTNHIKMCILLQSKYGP